MIILVIIGYFYRKRENRMKLYRVVNNTIRRSRRPGSPRKGGRGFFSSGKLFGRNSGNYERVLEDADGANEFELGDADSSDDTEHSDSSGGSRVGRTSGLATPRMNVVGVDGTYFDPVVPNEGVGLGLQSVGGVHAFDRAGLVVRTESRERLGPHLQMLGAGRRSRAASPTRLKSPLMAPLEEV
jgi:Golgi apyrase